MLEPHGRGEHRSPVPVAIVLAAVALLLAVLLAAGGPQTVMAAPGDQCQDGVDNDADLLIDLADPGCSGPDDNDETDDAPTPTPTDTPTAEPTAEPTETPTTEADPTVTATPTA